MVELIGPPGVGKSALTEALVARAEGRLALVRSDGWRHLPRTAARALRLSPAFAGQWPAIGQRHWQRFLAMVQLETLFDAVADGLRGRAEVVLLDQGPVYLLSILQRMRSPVAARNHPRFERYWHETLRRWAARLDLVVELEASDRELSRRIRARGKPHPVVRMSDDRASEFLRRSRASKRQALAALSGVEGASPRVAYLTTAGVPLDDAADAVLDLLSLSPLRP